MDLLKSARQSLGHIPDCTTPHCYALVLATMFPGALFEEVTTSDSISLFATINWLGDKSQEFVRDYFVKAVLDKSDVFTAAASTFYQTVTTNTFQPYVMSKLDIQYSFTIPPRSQALCYEHVSSLEADLTHSLN
jgi:hypothetical protein